MFHKFLAVPCFPVFCSLIPNWAWNCYFFLLLVCLLFVTQLWLLNPPYYKKELVPGIPASKFAPQQSITHWKVRWPFCFICSYTLLVTQHHKCARNFSTWIQSLWKLRLKAIMCTPIINYALKVKLPLRFICSYAPFATQCYRGITV